MLQVSDTAATAFRSYLDDETTPGSVIRLEVVSAAGDGMPTAIRFTPAEGPAEGDVRADAGDVEIYIARELSEPLSDALLDAQDTPEGTQIVLRRQGTVDH
jgi:Fe-S cluster assembly iron-binding protein IscA